MSQDKSKYFPLFLLAGYILVCSNSVSYKQIQHKTGFTKTVIDKAIRYLVSCLTLLHSERPNLDGVLSILSAKGIIVLQVICFSKIGVFISNIQKYCYLPQATWFVGFNNTLWLQMYYDTAQILHVEAIVERENFRKQGVTPWEWQFLRDQISKWCKVLAEVLFQEHFFFFLRYFLLV